MTLFPFRTLDTDLPDEPELPRFTAGSEIDISKLPCSAAVHCLPPEITRLLDCARHQIDCVEQELANDPSSSELQDALDDGFFLCDLSVIRRKLQRWYQLFPRIKPFFAVKCNPNVLVTSVLGQFHEQCGFDCASLSEIRLVLRQCTNSSSRRRILYANPQRAERDLEEALRLGVHALTFDDAAELHKIHKAHQAVCTDSSTPTTSSSGTTNLQPPELVLRILVPDGSSTVPLGEKFGASLDKVESLTREAMQLDMEIVGISFHCGSGNHDPNAYEQAIRLARDGMDIVNRIQSNSNCRLLDIGGGFPGVDGGDGDVGRFTGAVGTLPEKDSSLQDCEGTAAAIAVVVTPLVDQLFPSDIHVIAEPGRYFVQAAFALCSRIYSVRVEEEAESAIYQYYIAQGVQGVFKDVILCGEKFVPMPLAVDEASSSSELYISTVYGPSGDEYDIVCREVMLPRLHVGDWLVFDRMGAYTLSIAARSGSQPIRYVMGA